MSEPKELYDSWWVRREKQYEERLQLWMLKCQNAERARDEADAHRNRLEAELKVAKDCVSFNAYRTLETENEALQVRVAELERLLTHTGLLMAQEEHNQLRTDFIAAREILQETRNSMTSLSRRINQILLKDVL